MWRSHAAAAAAIWQHAISQLLAYGDGWLRVCAGDGMDPALVALLAAAGKSASSLPPDMSLALVGGKVSTCGLSSVQDVCAPHQLQQQQAQPVLHYSTTTEQCFAVILGSSDHQLSLAWSCFLGSTNGNDVLVFTAGWILADLSSF